MNELIGQVTSALKGMWKFRWQGLAVAWGVGVVGATVALKMPDQYEASARLFIDTQSVLKLSMSGLAVPPDVDQQVAMLNRSLISRPTIEKLVSTTDPDSSGESKTRQEARVENLMRRVNIKSTAEDKLYTLEYRDEDADKAKQMIQSLVSIFVESSPGASPKETDSAKIIIDEQIKTYEAKLAAAEARLKEIQLRNIDLQKGDGKDSANRLAELSTQLETAKLQLREAETARNAARTQLAAEKSAEKAATASLATDRVPQESAPSVATPETDARIEAQKKNLDNLLQRYTDRHPDVIGTRRLITELEEQRRAEVAELRKAAIAAPSTGGSSGASRSGASRELAKLLASAEAELATRRAHVAELTSRANEARSLLKAAPQTAAEAAQLERDYAIDKKNYEALVAQRQSAASAAGLDSGSGGAAIRLVDPTRVSPQPVSPNRLILVALALIAALGAGFFTAFAANQWRPVFHQAGELRGKIDLPLLGVVSLISSEVDRRRERASLARFMAASSLLVGAFSVVMIATVMISKK